MIFLDCACSLLTLLTDCDWSVKKINPAPEYVLSVFLWGLYDPRAVSCLLQTYLQLTLRPALVSQKACWCHVLPPWSFLVAWLFLVAVG